jgi:SulP family sulfate permease
LLLLVYLAAPLASYIPLGALGAILALVSWNMAEHREFASILRLSKPDAVILLATFLLTIFRDLTEGIAAGVVLAAFVFMHRMAAMATVGPVENADENEIEESETGLSPDAAGKTLTFRIEGPFFYGVASEIAEVLERIGDPPDRFIIDLSAMPFCDMTAAHALKGVIGKLEHAGVSVSLTGARPEIAAALNRFGVRTA